MREVTLASIKEELKTKRRVTIQGFGTFELKIREARKWKNPRTGEVVDKPAREVVTFKASKTFFT